MIDTNLFESNEGWINYINFILVLEGGRDFVLLEFHKEEDLIYIFQKEISRYNHLTFRYQDDSMYVYNKNKIKQLPSDMTDEDLGVLLGFYCIWPEWSNYKKDRILVEVFENQTNLQITSEFCPINVNKQDLRKYYDSQITRYDNVVKNKYPFTFRYNISLKPGFKRLLDKILDDDITYVEENIEEYNSWLENFYSFDHDSIVRNNIMGNFTRAKYLFQYLFDHPYVMSVFDEREFHSIENEILRSRIRSSEDIKKIVMKH